MRSGEVVYVHGRYGHGRTGVVAACVLVRLYGVCAEEALCKTGQFHERRRNTDNATSPQTAPQVRAKPQCLLRFFLSRVISTPPGPLPLRFPHPTTPPPHPTLSHVAPRSGSKQMNQVVRVADQLRALYRRDREEAERSLRDASQNAPSTPTNAACS